MSPSQLAEALSYLTSDERRKICEEADRIRFHRHLEEAAREVKTWPLWKQKILEQSGQPTVPQPRKPIPLDD